MTSLNLTVPAAFFAGLLSFFSPCILPLVPSYMSYITGSVFGVTKDNTSPAGIERKTVSYSACFILGFSAVFILMGIAASYAGGLLLGYKDLIRTAGGTLIIIFGLHVMGWLRIGFLNSYLKLDVKNPAPGYLRSFFVGVIFAAGWTPCVGPILGSILILAGNSADISTGLVMLCSYSLGMAVPFFVISLSANFFLSRLKKLNRWIPVINYTSGAVLIAAGILLATGLFDRLAYIFY